MIDKIKKRDGREVPFDPTKIAQAIYKASSAAGGESYQRALELTLQVINILETEYPDQVCGVEDIQDIVERVLIENGHVKTAKAYILYRAMRTRYREAKSDLMDIVAEILRETHKENANISNSPSSKMLQIGSAASKQYYLNRLVPPHFAEAHREGDLHIHDLDYYQITLNCLQIPLGRLLTSGFDNGHGYIRPPRRPASASALAAIILQSSQNDMFGGQSLAFFDREMAPYFANASDAECYQAMEALVYNLNSMHSRAGNQVPFSSLNFGDATNEAARRVTKNLLLAYEAGLGRGENPIFPNLIFRIKEGVNLNPGDPNYDLFQLALRVVAKRMNPTFSFMDATFNRTYGTEVAYMGCRTRVIANCQGPEVTAGRGNLSFTTLNLPRLALQSQGNLDRFYHLLQDRVELICSQLYHRYQVQSRLRVKDLPFIMGQHLYLGSEGLSPEDTIGPAIQHGTLSVGFIGLAETLVGLIGKHHGESEEAQDLGIALVKYMRKLVDQAVADYNLNYTLLATPAESLSGRFVLLDREKYGSLPGITDKAYYTNSFHIPPAYPIATFDKIKREGEYHAYCNAGHISYVEIPSPPVHNQEALEAIIRYMKESNLGYAGINFPIDYCESCGFQGLINQHCPQCQSSEIKRIRRITGYLSTVNRFNSAKMAELQDRQTHWGK